MLLESHGIDTKLPQKEHTNVNEPFFLFLENAEYSI